jgi:hypothetical protein
LCEYSSNFQLESYLLKFARKFEEEQERNRQEIVKKLLQEDQVVEKKKKLYPNLFNINLKPIQKDVYNTHFSNIWLLSLLNLIDDV